MMDILEEIGRGEKAGDESNKWCLETADMKKSASLHIQEVEKLQTGQMKSDPLWNTL